MWKADPVPNVKRDRWKRWIAAAKTRIAKQRERVAREREESLVDPVTPPVQDVPVEPEHPVPPGVRAAAEWSWRLLVIVAAVALIGWLAWQFRVAVFPVVAALLMSAGLMPAVRRLRAFGWGRGLAATTVFVVFLSVIVGALVLVGDAVGDRFSVVVDQASEGLEEIKTWFTGPPFNLDQTQLDEWLNRVASVVRDNEVAVTESAATAAGVAVEIMIGVLLTLFTLIFFLYDGDRIWAWLTQLVPEQNRERVASAGAVAWQTLTQYVRGTIVVAFFDAVTITILLMVMRVPLAFPLGVLVFFGAFVPLIGAFVTGALAVLVALVTQGPLAAIVVLAGIIAIQQLEGHVFQPFILGRMVRIHPLAVVIAVAIGSLAGGVIGAIIAVPIVAVVNTVVKHVVGARMREGEASLSETGSSS